MVGAVIPGGRGMLYGGIPPSTPWLEAEIKPLGPVHVIFQVYILSKPVLV